MAYEQEASVLIEQRAERLQYETNETTGFAKLTRGWPVSTGIARSSLLTFMSLYVSGKNYPTARRWITDPQADSHGTNPDGTAKNPYPGRWRMINWYYSDKIDRYVQELVRVETTAPESAARYRAFGLSNQSGKLTLQRFWPRMDPDVVQAIIQGTDSGGNPNITAEQVIGPMADGQVYDGTYTAKLTQGVVNVDGGVELIQTLTLAGDANIDIYVGDDPTHQSYTKYLFDASKLAVDAVMTSTTFPATNRPVGWAAEPGPSWGLLEAGIEKAVQITQNEDGSLNMIAKYVKSTMAQGLVEHTVQYSATPDWDINVSHQKIPNVAFSSDEGYRVIGYAIYAVRCGSERKVQVTVKRTFSFSYPSMIADDLDDAKNGYLKGYPDIGAGTSVSYQIIEVSKGVWCKETKKIVTTKYSAMLTDAQLIISYSNGAEE